MIAELPLVDYIVHANLDKLSFVQKEYVKLLNTSINFMNITFHGLLDRITRQYNSASIISILGLVKNTLFEEENSCPDAISFDDFVKNASLVSQSLEKIISSPSSKLTRVDKNVPANRVTRFDSHTMMWLSRRSGISIEEKISPHNIIPTKVTIFTYDTIENRHSMYLYNILYDYLYEKVYPNERSLKCNNCTFIDKKCYGLYEKLKSLLLLKYKITTSELNDIPKQKQLRQNNKLISDKEYKLIWDSVSDIDFFESRCKDIWNNLEHRFQFIIFLFISAFISSSSDIMIYDSFCQIIDKDGVLSILDDSNRVNHIGFHSITLNKDIVLSLERDELVASVYEYNKTSSNCFEKGNVRNKQYRLDTIFGFLDEVKNVEKKYLTLVESIASSKIEQQKTKLRLDDFYAKHKLISEMTSMMELKILEMILDGEENQKSKEQGRFPIQKRL